MTAKLEMKLIKLAMLTAIAIGSGAGAWKAGHRLLFAPVNDQTLGWAPVALLAGMMSIGCVLLVVRVATHKG